MSDTRTKRQKLEAMARQTVSPNEAEIARRKLREMEAEPKARQPEGLFGGRPLETRAYADPDFQETIRRMHEAMFGRNYRSWEPPKPDRTNESRAFHAFEPGPGRSKSTMRCLLCGLTRTVGPHLADT